MDAGHSGDVAGNGRYSGLLLAGPDDGVGRRLLAPWRDISAGLTVYLTAGVLAADMLWLRRKFCSHACPYGPLLSTMTDQNTLAVRFLTEREDECISCHKCEMDCPMEIDIKQGVGQHGCIGCGECVDPATMFSASAAWRV